jgi:hypothetical protein
MSGFAVELVNEQDESNSICSNDADLTSSEANKTDDSIRYRQV